MYLRPGKLINSFLRKLDSKINPAVVKPKQAYRFFEKRKKEFDPLINAITPYIDPNGAIFDIGANIGYFSLLLFEKINFKGEAHLFEPVENLANICQGNFDKTDFNVTIHKFGLSDENCEPELFLGGDGNIGWNTLISKKTTHGMTPLKIQVKTFDSSEINVTPSFIKIDVEGAEYKVFRGMMNSLKEWKKKPVILCEVGWGVSHPDWDEELRIFDELQAIGYSIFNINKQKIDVRNIQKTTDILLIAE